MIGVFDLEVLLNSYGIDHEKVLDNNEKILSIGEYSGIKKILDYLLLEVGISAKNVEKCPSVLYFNVDAVRINYEFLSSTGITMDNVNNINTFFIAVSLSLLSPSAYLPIVYHYFTYLSIL